MISFSGRHFPKDIFQNNNNWQRFEEKNRSNLREAIISD
jgi:hypothetical protein